MNVFSAFLLYSQVGIIYINYTSEFVSNVKLLKVLKDKALFQLGIEGKITVYDSIT